MKTLKIKETTHKILKWIQTQDIIIGKPKNEIDIDSIIFKSLAIYALQNHYNLNAIKDLITNEGN